MKSPRPSLRFAPLWACHPIRRETLVVIIIMSLVVVVVGIAVFRKKRLVSSGTGASVRVEYSYWNTIVFGGPRVLSTGRRYASVRLGAPEREQTYIQAEFQNYPTCDRARFQCRTFNGRLLAEGLCCVTWISHSGIYERTPFPDTTRVLRGVSYSVYGRKLASVENGEGHLVYVDDDDVPQMIMEFTDGQGVAIDTAEWSGLLESD